MNEKEDQERIEKLSGIANYYGWRKIINLEIDARNYRSSQSSSIVKDESDDSADNVAAPKFKANSKAKAAAFILKNVSLDITAMCPETDPEMILQWLEEEFGSTDFYSAKRDLKAVKMDGIDLTSFWKEYNKRYAHLLACGGMMSYADQLETVLENVHQRFYRDVIISTRKSIGNLQSEKINRSHFTTLRSNLLEHYNVTPI
ncbi:hypothetical protein HK103_007444, partial [Boothiomyces macroporosus]